MISDSSIKTISSIFCGDIEGYYEYKTGAKLVRFFNQNFGYKDIYQSGFPSRWTYVYNKLLDFINNGRINEFFSLILSKSYIVNEFNCSEIAAVDKAQDILNEFNKTLKADMCSIINKGAKYYLIKNDDDLQYIGGGGFANVYFKKSTGVVVKKLKDDYLADIGIRSRFKREFNITKSLQDLGSRGSN
jgi:hypothetical protein